MSTFTRALKLFTLVEKKVLYKQAKNAYYNNEDKPMMTDAEFDKLEESIREENPTWVGLKKTGIKPKKVGKKTEVDLPVPMPSLDKLQSGNPDKLTRWARSVDNNVVIGSKYDGSSLQGEWRFGKLTRLITRGDGVVGKDVSYFIHHVNLPLQVKDFRSLESVVIRFEAVVKTKVWAAKYSEDYDSARAMASSVFNRQDLAPGMKDVDFIALRTLAPTPPLSVGLKKLSTLGFTVQDHKVVKSEWVTDEHLVAYLAKIRKTCPYETDGLALFSDAANLDTTGDRPKYAKAFKVNDEEGAPVTKILEIKWQPSKHGNLVPKAIIEPIKFGGVTVKQAALHNAKWAMARGCGVGATVRVLRSGDIIPKIVSVDIKKTFALPGVKEFGAYDWDSTGTQLVLKNKQDNFEVVSRQFTNFFGKLDLDGFSSGMADKLVTAGYKNTWEICHLTAKEFEALPGVKASAKKYAAEIKRIRDGEFDVVKLMVASGCFDKGVGETRLRTLQDSGSAYANWRVIVSNDLIENIASISGCGPAFAKLYAKGLPLFRKWLIDSGSKVALPEEKKAKIKGKLSGLVFSFTGYRSADECAIIESLGGKVSDVSSKTNVLLFNPAGKFMDKVEKAKSKGITVVPNFEKYLKSV